MNTAQQSSVGTGKHGALVAFVLCACIAAGAAFDAHAVAFLRMFATTSANRIVSFTASTGTLTTNHAITGLGAGEVIGGIDFRPLTGELYGMARSVSGIRIVKIDVSTGAATIVSPAPFVLAGTAFGMTFDGSGDRIRLVSDADVNVRVNPDTGQISNVDTSLAYAGGDANTGKSPSVVHLAITNDNVSGTGTFYGIDTGTNAIVRLGDPGNSVSPNSGKLYTIANLNLTLTSKLGGLDIDPGTQKFYAVLHTTDNTGPTVYDLTSPANPGLGFPVLTSGATIDGFAVARIDDCNDLDGNGKVDALTDGLMYIRALFGLTGTAVTDGAIGAGASRNTWASIRDHMNTRCGMAWGP